MQHFRLMERFFITCSIEIGTGNIRMMESVSRYLKGSRREGEDMDEHAGGNRGIARIHIGREQICIQQRMVTWFVCMHVQYVATYITDRLRLRQILFRH